MEECGLTLVVQQDAMLENPATMENVNVLMRKKKMEMVVHCAGMSVVIEQNVMKIVIYFIIIFEN